MPGLGASNIREIVLRLIAEDDASAAIANVGNSLNRMQSSFAQFGKGMVLSRLGQGIESIGKKMLGVSTATATMALDFGRSMQMVQTQAQLTGRQFDSLSAGALRVAGHFGQGSQTIADGLYDIFSSTDVSYKQALNMVRNYAKAATAGGTDVRTVSRSAIATMNALGMKSSQTKKILDIQFQSVRKGVFTYEQFASAIGNLLPYGASADQTLQTLAGSMAFMSRNGFTAAQSSISAARALDQLTRSSNSVKLKKVLGVDVVDPITGGFKQLNDIISEMAGKMKGLTGPEIAGKLGDVFGAGEIRAMRFFRLAIPHQAELNKRIGEMGGPQVAGQMKKAFDIMRKSPSVQWQILLERIKAIGIELGQALVPILKVFINIIGDIVKWFDKLSPTTKKWISIGFAFIGVVLTLGGAIISLVGAFYLMNSILTFTGVSMGFIIGVSGGILLAIAAIIAIGVLLYKNWDFVKKWAIIVWDAIKNAIVTAWHAIYAVLSGVWDFLNTYIIQPFLTMEKFLIDVWVGIFNAVWPILTALFNIIVKVFTDIWDTIKFILGVIIAVWKVEWAIFSAVFKAVWAVFWAVFKTVWDILWLYLKAIWKFIVWEWKILWSILKAVWNTVGAPLLKVIVWIWKNILWPAIKFVFDIVKAGWKILWGAIKAVWESVGRPVFDFIVHVFTGVWHFLRDTFKWITDNWTALWNGIRDVFFGIANGIIGGIEWFVNKIIDAINWVRTKFGLDEIGHVTLGRIGGGAPEAGGGATGGHKKGGAPAGLAKGTNYWNGGWAMVGEQGPELAFLPKGSKVLPNRLTNMMNPGGLPGFANGLWDWGKDVLSHAIPGLNMLFGGAGAPGQSDLMNAAFGNLGLQLPGAFQEIPGKLLDMVKKWVSDAISHLASTMPAMSGTSGGWGGFSNGMIPLSAMTQVQPGKYLEPTAAIAFMAMQGAYGSSIPIVSAYRSYAEQAALYANRGSNPWPVAPPGTSNHGWGKAVDISSGTSPWSWMYGGNSSRFGWNPLQGDLPHFNFMHAGGTVVNSGAAFVQKGETIRPARSIGDYRSRENSGELHVHIEPQKAVVDEKEIVNELDWMRRTRGW